MEPVKNNNVKQTEPAKNNNVVKVGNDVKIK